MDHVAGMEVVKTLTDIIQLVTESARRAMQQGEHLRGQVCLHLSDSRCTPRGPGEASIWKRAGEGQ